MRLDSRPIDLLTCNPAYLLEGDEKVLYKFIGKNFCISHLIVNFDA